MKVLVATRPLCLLLFNLILLWSVAGFAETPVERGAYLVQGIAGCGNCHTPKGPEGDLPGKDLAGMVYKDSEGQVIFEFPNITPDPETGVGDWSEEELVAAIREGRRPDGSVMSGVMPFQWYRQISDNDVLAIVAYIRSLPPIKNEIPRPELGKRMPLEKDSQVTAVPDISPDDPVAYGEYLAGPVGHCVECHTPRTSEEGDDTSSLGAGGNVFGGPWGQSVSANITPTGLGHWTDDEVKTMITTGMRPGGLPMKPPMGYAYYANISDADLDAIVAYLRSLPSR